MTCSLLVSRGGVSVVGKDVVGWVGENVGDVVGDVVGLSVTKLGHVTVTTKLQTAAFPLVSTT